MSSTTLQHPDRVFVGHGMRLRQSEITPEVRERASALARRTLAAAAEQGVKLDALQTHGEALAVVIKCDRTNRLRDEIVMFDEVEARPPAKKPAAPPTSLVEYRRSRERACRPRERRSTRSSARSGDSGSDDSGPPPPGVDWRWAHQGRWSA
jgi:hypothetical protein